MARQTITEPQRETPAHGPVDVLVCGGGPAGVCAAIAAARTGARTTLVDSAGCLGGTWTAGLVTWLLDYRDKGGLVAEIVARLDARNARRLSAFDVEEMKRLLEEMCLEAGVAVRLHTRIVAAATQGGTVRAAITESKSGREAWPARVLIDCTGDGDLAARAGCGFDLGRPDDGRCQPLSLNCLLTGVRAAELVESGVLRDGFGAGETKKRFAAELQRAGVTTSYRSPTLFAIRDELIGMMTNHEYGVRADDAGALTDATLRARSELHRTIDALRSLGGVWRDVRIVATAEHIGIREGRRVHGLYTVTVEDLRDGARHADAVCRANFGFDVHGLFADGDPRADRPAFSAQPYDIPLRSLIARDADNLLLAGRCVSGDFFAHSSYRVTGDAAALGEAAGVAAALAARTNVAPAEVPFAGVQAAREALTTAAPAG